MLGFLQSYAFCVSIFICFKFNVPNARLFLICCDETADIFSFPLNDSHRAASGPVENTPTLQILHGPSKCDPSNGSHLALGSDTQCQEGAKAHLVPSVALANATV